MTIDNTPAIRAYVKARIKRHTDDPVHGEVIKELELILALCDELMKQNELLVEAIFR